MLKFFLLVCFTVNVLVDSIPLDESAIKERIYGGNDTDISQVPYQVAVYMHGHFLCGGFIVSPSYIVTSAHCQLRVRESHFTVRAGSTSMMKGGTTVRIRKFHLHPMWIRSEDDYDVAVIELATPLKLNNKTMKAIKLATKEPSPGSVALISGWGYTDYEDEELTSTEILQSVTLPILDRSKCAALLKPHEIIVTPRMICTFTEDTGPDIRDTGDPLVYNGEAVGVFSPRYAWTDKRMPHVFASIAHPEITKFIKDVAKL